MMSSFHSMNILLHSFGRQALQVPGDSLSLIVHRETPEVITYTKCFLRDHPRDTKFEHKCHQVNTQATASAQNHVVVVVVFRKEHTFVDSYSLLVTTPKQVGE